MRRRHLVAMVSLVLALVILASGPAAADDRDGEKDSDQMLVHSVYFTLKDRTPAARKKLVQACKKYLSKHPGEVSFTVGTVCEDLKRPVNDLDFDVALT